MNEKGNDGGAQRGEPTRDGAAPLIVGVGASAGGLEALQKLLDSAPRSGGVSYVVVQHLDPTRPSLLVELLARRTSLPVREAQNGTLVEPDQVWVTPPDATLTLSAGVLRVASPVDPHRHPIDVLLRSLAEDQGDRAAAIVLSGTGDDGTIGMRAVREHGGLTLAQAPATAVHPGMPQSAILAGVVDEVLRPEEMPRRLHAHLAAKSAAPPGDDGGDARPAPPEEAGDLVAALPEICEILRRRTGNDFSGYKRGTLLRRLRRRLLVQRLSKVSEYIRLLDADGSPELGLLLRDLLIAVTRFFRDKAAFDALAEHVIPSIVQAASEIHPVRVWVPGCATGEEVYSIAMLLTEEIERAGPRAVQIFATDIDAASVQTARAGRYGEAVAEDVSPARLERFFAPQHGGFQVVKELREMCVFSVHNLLRDPPFSQIDLVSCRNVLIYFGADLQARVLPFFHYALRRSGCLFLGPSEDVSGGADLFTPVDKQQRIFRRRETVGRFAYDFPLQLRAMTAGPPEAPSEPRGRSAKQTVSLVFERMILEEYAPACALVDDRGEIVSVAGPFSRYFTPRAGLFSGNILDHAEGTLRHALRTALSAASGQAQPVTNPRVVVPAKEGVLHLELTVRPAPGGSQAAGLHAVILREVGPALDAAPALDAMRSHEPLIEQLESELSTTRADLSAAVAELESTNQELKSSNEELMSTNEELQSANEELQTSKEELQSVNEELETVNAELRAMVRELGVANSDLQNLFASTSVATIFLDRDLAVTRFTPTATELFSLIDADVGRPLADLVPRFTGTDLIRDVRGVLASLAPAEKEVHTDSAWFMVRVLPYRTVDDLIAGAVVTFTDVTRIKLAEAAVRESEHLLKDILDASPLVIFLEDLEGRFVTVNKQFLTFAGRRHEEVAGKTAHDVFPRERADRYAEHDRQVLAAGDLITLEDTVTLDDGEHTYLAYRFPLHDADGKIYGISGIFQDITERKRWERATRDAERRDREVLDAMPQLVWTCTPDGRRDFFNRQWSEYTGVPAESHLGLGWLECVHPDDRARVMEKWTAALAESKNLGVRLRLRSAAGEYRWFRSRGVPLRGDDGEIVKWIGTSTDIHELVCAEQDSMEASRRKSEFLALLSHELRNPLAPIRTSLEILAKVDPGSEQARRAHGVLQRQVGQLARLVDDLLDMTRISEDKIRLQREDVDLAALVRQTLDDHRAMFEGAGLRLEVTVPSEPVPVWADPARIAQVVGNLLQNAAKFSQPGGRTWVSVRVEPPTASEPGKGCALIRIQDEGIGMTEDTIAHLFQPFVQADASLDRSRGGLGLGLSLVKGLVELHGGHVVARSAGLGQGTEMEVCLPLKDDAPAARAAGVPVGSPPRGRRVLIIDDNVDGAEALRDFLEMDGHEVRVAFDGPSGLSAARAHRPEVVVCDIGLPGMTGYDVARALRAEPGLGGAFLVALTGYAQPEDVEKAKAAGFDHHLSKPPDVTRLEALLRQV